MLVRGSETAAWQQPMLVVVSCISRTWALFTTDVGFVRWGNSIGFTRKYLHLWTTWVFLLYTVGNSKVLGLLSSFSPQIIQDQKTLRTNLHRFKCNQHTKNPKQIKKRTVMQKVKLTFVCHIFLFTPSYWIKLLSIHTCHTWSNLLDLVAYPADNFQDFGK